MLAINILQGLLGCGPIFKFTPIIWTLSSFSSSLLIIQLNLDLDLNFGLGFGFTLSSLLDFALSPTLNLRLDLVLGLN